MKAAVLSVPHTGTHFVWDLLGGKREGLKTIGGTIHENDQHTLIGYHVYDSTMFEDAEQKGYNIVVPMRHPMTTARSWVQWEDKHDELEHTSKTDPEILKWRVQPERLTNLYKTLILGDQLYDVNFLPVDSENRQEFLDRFNSRYDLDLSTEWKPINSIGKHTATIPENIEEEIETLMKDNKEFFGQFYSEAAV